MTLTILNYVTGEVQVIQGLECQEEIDEILDAYRPKDISYMVTKKFQLTIKTR